jgi:uncharacterized membrane protein YccC
MDRQALLSGLFGIAIGAMGCYCLVRRAWLRAAGVLALGAAALLNMITEGPHSPAEDLVKWVVTTGLLVIFAVAVVADGRSARDRPADRH